jgi:hypothetical protein
MRREIVALGLLVVGCGGALADGRAEFNKGRYAEAKRTFLRAEAESHAWSEKKRAEYALYRGLTHGALGDRAAASAWLRQAKAIEDTRPGTLGDDDRARLSLGLDSVASEVAPPSP